jgi:hypothetical protein
VKVGIARIGTCVPQVKDPGPCHYGGQANKADQYQKLARKGVRVQSSAAL